jgi:hypothetical protein
VIDQKFQDALARMAGTLGDPKKILEGLRELAKERGGLVRDEASDPGVILLELLTLLHCNTLYHISSEIAELLASVLSLAGLSRRPARPASTVIAVLGATGQKFAPGAVYLVPKHDAEPQSDFASVGFPAGQRTADPDDLTFTPAWEFCCWRAAPVPLPRGDEAKPIVWPVVVPARFIPAAGAAQDEWLHALLNGANDQLPALHRAEWFFCEADAARPFRRLTIEEPRKWIKTLAESARLWLTCAAKAMIFPDRWVFLRIASTESSRPPHLDIDWGNRDWEKDWKASWELPAPAEKGKSGPVPELIEALKKTPSESKPEVKRGWLICVPTRETASVSLWSNHIPWLNYRPERKESAPLPPDHAAAVRLEKAICAGEKGNGFPPGEWSVWHGPEGLKAWNVETSVGGLDQESDGEFLHRAPAVLRHRGAPVSARDWEQLVQNLDPIGRIAGAAAREGFFEKDGEAVAGVEIAFHCQGENALAAEALAQWLYSDLEQTLNLLRPLGTFVRLLRPSLVKGTLTITLPSFPKLRDDDRKEREKSISAWVNLNEPQPAENGFWKHLRASFKHVYDRELTPAGLVAQYVKGRLEPESKERRDAINVRFTPGTAADAVRSRSGEALWPVPWVQTETVKIEQPDGASRREANNS